ncbi:MAG TPA: hypothetical protein VFH28_04270 [Nitrososphaera sp.]|nr:hypothetical protein [Nitrososphaera sp.]
MMLKIMAKGIINTPSPKGASHDIIIHLELGFTRYIMVITTLQQITDERISFLKSKLIMAASQKSTKPSRYR